MAKYYVISGKQKLICNSTFPVLAASYAYHKWSIASKKCGRTITVSEVGFGDEHPHHVKDHVIATNFIKSLIA
jgi:hypothetical protein